ncbi:MAG: amidohydrolase [Planctomycetes bacterium]|nr:amidohydrolase [Planctomycetota bacterium]
MEEDHPWAASVVITGNTITAVLDEGESFDVYKGDDTRVIDLGGKFVVPGFIDGHMHFNNAGGLINDADLMNVSDDEGLKKEMQRVVNILGPGEWITGGLWGAYEEWSLGAETAEEKKQERWEPQRWTIDEITTNNPCLLSSYDNSALSLANTVALQAAGLIDNPVEGMKLNDEGVPTGLIYRGSPALSRIRSVRTSKSHERMLNENRAALQALAAAGIVEIHDIAQTAQTARFAELQKNGELTCRVWLRPDLSRGAALKAQGLTMQLHPITKQPDRWLRFGALKGYIDGIMGTHGALFFEPYDDMPNNYGNYRRHTSNDARMQEGDMEKMYNLIKVGLDAGFVPNVHAIGTKGVDLMLDTYERLKNEGVDLTGFRVIHAQVIRDQDFPRFQQLGVIAEVNSYHISDDMRWMEERIGSERCKGAYAFKSLLDNGAMLSFGSDWPGTSAARYLMHPKYLIHAAVNRTTVKHAPEGGWFPEQKISVHEALKAYTINNAFAAFEADIRGSIKAGKLADIAVCDLNLMTIEPENILDMNVDMTIIDGKIIFERAGQN